MFFLFFVEIHLYHFSLFRKIHLDHQIIIMHGINILQTVIFSQQVQVCFELNILSAFSLLEWIAQQISLDILNIFCKIGSEYEP